MIDRFLARVGTFGAILILVVAVFVTGLAGAALEHVRLAARQQQAEQSRHQGEPSQQGRSQQGSQAESGDSKSQKQSGQQGKSDEGESTSSGAQQGEH
jgi:cytoskeletal protein RodZ